MRTKHLIAGVVGVGLLVMAGPVRAHHAFSSEFDVKKRRDLVNQIQRYLIDKAYVIPLGVKPAIIAYNLHAHNIEPPPFSHQWYAEVWFDS